MNLETADKVMQPLNEARAEMEALYNKVKFKHMNEDRGFVGFREGIETCMSIIDKQKAKVDAEFVGLQR